MSRNVMVAQTQPPLLSSVTPDAIINFLSRREDPELQEIVTLAADLCGGSAAGITVLKDGAYHIPVATGVEPFACPASDTFCQFAMGSHGIYEVEDALDDPRYAGLGWVNGQIAKTRFYASAPLVTEDGLMVGRLCVTDTEPHRLTSVQTRTLETLAANVMRTLELHLMQEELRGGSLGHRLNQIAELSHDLRIPATSVVASAEMLADELAESANPAVAALLRRLTGASQRLLRMLEQTMDYSEEMQLPAPFEAVDIGEVARNFVEEAKPWLEPRGATVTIGDLPVVKARPGQIYSVIQNLVTNAVKYATPTVAPVVHIDARFERGMHRIRIADNGRGIAPERRAEVFAMFSTSDSATPGPGSGHGIGLATVQRIVTSQGGNVGITDSDLGGTEVWFTLPG